jgi:hypothetical protein
MKAQRLMMALLLLAAWSVDAAAAAAGSHTPGAGEQWNGSSRGKLGSIKEAAAPACNGSAVTPV